MECYCCLRNIKDSLANGRTPYEKRLTAPLDVLIWPFAKNLYKPTHLSDKAKGRLQLLGKKMLVGIFIGYGLHTRGGWTRDLLRADREELERTSRQKFMSKDSNPQTN